MTMPRILIAGIGNIFLADDAFGVEVAQRLAQRPQPEGVRVVDFGIRGLDLTYALMDQCDVAILVDAVPRGEAPGTLYVIEPDMIPAAQAAAGAALPDGALPGGVIIDAHNLDPAKVLQLVANLGGKVQRVLLVGCEPTPFDPELDIEMDMSPPVRAAVEEAIPLVESLIARIRGGMCLSPGPAAPCPLLTGDSTERSSASC